MIVPAANTDWPITLPNRVDAVRVEFTAGYSAPALIPEPIRTAILFGVVHLFENRDGGEMPAAFYHLLDPWRIVWF